MDSKHGGGYFKFWMTPLNDFNRGEIHEGTGTCHANNEMLLIMQKDLKELKLIMQDTHNIEGKCSGMKTMLFLNIFFFIFVVVLLIMGVFITAT